MARRSTRRYDEVAERRKMLDATSAKGLNGATLAELRARKGDGSLGKFRQPLLDDMVESKALLRVGGGPRYYRFVHADIVRKHLGVEGAGPRQEIETRNLTKAYGRLVQRARGNQHVMIAELADEVGVDAAALSPLLRELVDQERAELTTGDWSLASKAERKAAIRWLNRDCLQVRLLN